MFLRQRFVAQDAQFKFLRFGVPSSCYVEPRLQQLAAQVLGPGDVALIVSSAGKLPELLEVAETARERGAQVLAITASHSPLVRKADVALLVDHQEDVSTHLPMVARILHLLVIDILSVGLAMRRGVVAYSYAAKEALLGVPKELLEEFGAVSPEVAEAMAKGALERFGADVAVSITGVAGPTGGSEEKPVGYVCFNARLADGTSIARDPVIPGDRHDIRERSALVAMHLLRNLLGAGEETSTVASETDPGA